MAIPQNDPHCKRDIIYPSDHPLPGEKMAPSSGESGSHLSMIKVSKIEYPESKEVFIYKFLEFVFVLVAHRNIGFPEYNAAALDGLNLFKIDNE